MIESRRYHEITLDEVAQTAGVGKGTIYRYFDNKEDLFLQLALEGYDSLCALLRDRILPEDLPLPQKIRLLCEELTKHMQRRRNLMRVVREEETRHVKRMLRGSDSIRRKREELLAATAEILAQGVDRCVLRPDIDLKHAAVLLHGMLMARHHATRHDNNVPDLDLIVEIFCNGIVQEEAK